MANNTSSSLIELIPADIRDHFVPRKRFIDFYGSLKYVKNKPHKRSDFVALQEKLLVEQSNVKQLRLELEKLKNSSIIIIDGQSEPDEITVSTKTEQASVTKEGMHEPVYHILYMKYMI